VQEYSTVNQATVDRCTPLQYTYFLWCCILINLFNSIDCRCKSYHCTAYKPHGQKIFCFVFH